MSVANSSAHLQVLAGAQLVVSRKAGLRVHYRLADPSVYRLWAALREAGSTQLAEIDRLVGMYLHDRQALEPLSRDDLLARLTDGNTVVLDVRPVLEYEHGHVAGARSIPVDELETRLGELDPQREIVAYCRGPYCVYADDAVRLLRRRGLKASRLDVGFPEWRRADRPIEIAS